MIYFYLIIFLFVSIFFKIPILAIFGGIIFSLMFKTENKFITKKYSTIILQTGIVLLGFSINYQSAINSSLQYMPAISIFVVLTLTFVFLLGLSLKIDKNYSLLVASGSSICGGTAMISIVVMEPAPRARTIASAFLIGFHKGIRPARSVKAGTQFRRIQTRAY